MAKYRWISAALVAALPTGLMADIVKLPDGNAEIVLANDSPARGVAKAQVEKRYGAPTQQQAPVGEPAISRWDYPSYSVYFENDLVLHAVARQAQ